ncbi:hypothetical protein M8J77_016090 [Diaphorina citri]|nr:hypothetical protein M8J77_016090 [Diaphorina citri]
MAARTACTCGGAMGVAWLALIFQLLVLILALFILFKMTSEAKNIHIQCGQWGSRYPILGRHPMIATVGVVNQRLAIAPYTPIPTMRG